MKQAILILTLATIVANIVNNNNPTHQRGTRPSRSTQSDEVEVPMCTYRKGGVSFKSACLK
jgi:hypothetical protein